MITVILIGTWPYQALLKSFTHFIFIGINQSACLIIQLSWGKRVYVIFRVPSNISIGRKPLPISDGDGYFFEEVQSRDGDKQGES